MWLSTHDYAISKGECPRSPCATNEDIQMFMQNQQTKRDKIESELQKIPEPERINLVVYIKCINSNYIIQQIDVKIVKCAEIFHEHEYQLYSFDTHCDAWCYPEIWKTFNYAPFQMFKYNIFLNVPYSEKNKAKKLGCKWDNNEKKWYISNTSANIDTILDHWKY